MQWGSTDQYVGLQKRREKRREKGEREREREREREGGDVKVCTTIRTDEMQLIESQF